MGVDVSRDESTPPPGSGRGVVLSRDRTTPRCINRGEDLSPHTGNISGLSISIAAVGVRAACAERLEGGADSPAFHGAMRTIVPCFY